VTTAEPMYTKITFAVRHFLAESYKGFQANSKNMSQLILDPRMDVDT